MAAGSYRWPCAHVLTALNDGNAAASTYREEKPAAARSGPCREVVFQRLYFVAHLLDAEHVAGVVLSDQPLPKSRAEVQSVVQVLRLDENVGVQQVSHQNPTPRFSASSRNVAILRKPSSRNASVNDERPSRALETSARVKRLLARAPSVR